ncbi:Wall-associated receptor kinase 2 [Dichanthelium oligosanthes]|uniref:Wall-associated receptor kinase 2 n=1 Tax=Dichanthelium oligosanthes TaxID=888268 RepID=A0A1E5WBF6_9POAL|nr:Wall-associated receptor kinase 2 [Dichanthelium oligosanthes]
MAQVLWFLLPAAIVISHLVLVATGADNTVVPSPPLPAPRPETDCPGKCGDVDIPYPYGIGDHCSWRGKYSLTCNDSFDPPRPYLGNTEVLNISLEAGEMRILTPVSSECYNQPNNSANGVLTTVTTNLNVTLLLISTTRNEFTAIGCNTLALLQSTSYYTGCITSCMSLDAAAEDGDKCTGLGCCQMSIPENLTNLKVTWDKNRRKNRAWRYSPCSYAFVAEKGWYRFKRDDLDKNKGFSWKLGNRTLTEVPLVLDWAIRVDGSCPPNRTGEDGLSEESTASACVSANSHCVNTSHDINECELRKSDPRYEKQYPCDSGSRCHDTPGDYECKCNFGRRGDGKSDKGCQPIFPGYVIAILAEYVPCMFLSAATIVAFVLACFMIMELNKRKQKKFFDKNGGEILKSVGISIFTEGQLKKITNRYSTPIGEGAFGKVFMGTIDNAQQVAVKRASMKGKVLPKEEFVNEITFQFKISHANVVRLVGCCLQTDIPMLVFEFVPKGSLYNVLHGGTNDPQVLSLKQRLEIAIGSAEALAFMHSHGGQNHVHGDVKSANILLDDKLMPKVSDFGSSKLVSKSTYVRSVACDMNYIDPVYLQTDRFTAKSDVYSFGVVLLELITRKTVTYGNNSLIIDFKKSWKDEGTGQKMYDTEILSGDDGRPLTECLDRVGGLSVRCLREDVDERPTMARVVEELKEVKSEAFGDESTYIKKADC